MMYLQYSFEFGGQGTLKQTDYYDLLIASFILAVNSRNQKEYKVLCYYTWVNLSVNIFF